MPSLDLPTNKTVSFWVNLATVNAAGLILFGESASKYYPFLMANGQTMYLNDSSTVETLSLGATHAVPTDSSWNHIAITGDGTTSTAYINGVSRATGGDISPTGLTKFGGPAYSVDAGYSFVGLMDEVAVFNATLDATDITKIYNGGVPVDLTNSASYTGATDRSSNLLRYYRMGDNSSDSPVDAGNITSITDSSGNGNDATTTATSQPTFKALDSSTTLVSFDKNLVQGIQTPPGTFNLGTSPFTFSVWFKASSLVANYHAVFKAGSGTSSATMFITSNGDVQFSDWSNTQISSGFTVTAGVWHHAAFVKSTAGSTSIDMYVDGIFRNSGSLSTGDFTVSNNSIGHIGNGGPDYPYDGDIDEFAYFNSALTQSQITSLAATRGAHIKDDLSLTPVVYYRMGEDDSLADGDTVTQITDASGNGNHATTQASAQPTASVSPVIYV